MTSLDKTARVAFWPAAGGGSAVEFALIAPILLVLVMGTADFSMWIASRMQLAAAARAGADYAATHGYDATKITSAITGATGLQGVSASPAPAQSCGCPDAANGVVDVACGSTCPSGAAAGSYVTSTATATYATLFPWPGVASPVTLVSVAKVRVN